MLSMLCNEGCAQLCFDRMVSSWKMLTFQSLDVLADGYRSGYPENKVPLIYNPLTERCFITGCVTMPYVSFREAMTRAKLQKGFS